MRMILIIAAAAGLAGCAQTTSDEIGQTAEQPSAGNLEEQFPGVDVNALAKCVRDNASESELVVLAGGGEPAQETTATILGRENTQTCIVESGVELPSAS